jgi:hypothetical protein
MNAELKSLVENFLSENKVKLEEELKSIGNFNEVLSSTNKDYNKYEAYIDALKEGLIDSIEFENKAELSYKNNKIEYKEEKDPKKPETPVKEGTPLSNVVLHKESLGDKILFYDDKEKVVNISFVDHKIKDADNEYFIKSVNNLERVEIEKREDESEADFKRRKASYSGNKLGSVFKADLLNWLITRTYLAKYHSYRPNYEQFIKVNHDPKEYMDYVIALLRDYAIYKLGVVLQYKKPNDDTYYDIKPKLTLSKEYSDLNNPSMSIQSVVDAIREAKDRGDELVIEKQKSFVVAEPTVEEELASGVKVGGESDLRQHLDALCKKYPYHYKGEGAGQSNTTFNYKIPGIVKQYGEYTLITYTSVEDVHFWSKPTHNSAYTEKGEPLANESNPFTGKEGSWKNPRAAKTYIEDMSAEELKSWLNVEIYPFAEFGGASWCTSLASHSKNYKSKGSIFLILKNFLKLLQYAPSQSQFEYADSATHLDLSKSKDKNLLDDLTNNIPVFIDHCVEGGKDNYIESKYLKRYLEKRKYLPSINSYLRIHNEKQLSDEELLNYLSNFDLVINEEGLKLGKKLYQLHDHFGNVVNPWENIPDNLMQDFINVCNKYVSEKNENMINKVIGILTYILEGSANAFFKYRFSKGKNSALSFFNSITIYMIENHPNDKETINLLSKFSDAKIVNLKSAKEFDSVESDIIKTAKEVTGNKINYFSGEANIFYYSVVLAKNYKTLTESESEPELVKDIIKFFKDAGYTLDSDILTDIPTSILSEDTKKQALKDILKKYEEYFSGIKKKIDKVLRLEVTNSTIKNSRNLLLDSLISSNVDISNNQKFLEGVEKTLKELKINIENTDIYVQLFDPDYFDINKDPDLKGLSLIVSLLNKKHEIVDFSSVRGSDFSVTQDLVSSGVLKADDDGNYFLSKAQYDFLNKKINTYLQKKIFKLDPEHFTLTDTDFRNAKVSGVPLKNINPLELFLERIKSEDIPKEFKDSLIEIFNESMDKKLVSNLGNIISDFYKNVGDYIYTKIDLTELYEEFKSKYSK